MRSWLQKRIVGRHYEKLPSAFSFLAEKGGFAYKVRFNFRKVHVSCFLPPYRKQTALKKE